MRYHIFSLMVFCFLFSYSYIFGMQLERIKIERVSMQDDGADAVVHVNSNRQGEVTRQDNVPQEEEEEEEVQLFSREQQMRIGRGIVGSVCLVCLACIAVPLFVVFANK